MFHQDSIEGPFRAYSEQRIQTVDSASVPEPPWKGDGHKLDENDDRYLHLDNSNSFLSFLKRQENAAQIGEPTTKP